MVCNVVDTVELFQHTAARRRLRRYLVNLVHKVFVSTHSRAEAAALQPCLVRMVDNGFNTQPRGGGCLQVDVIRY